MVIGCSKKSPGCAGCYALNDTPARVLRHRGIETWGPRGTRHLVKGFAAKVRRLNRYCICDRCRSLHVVAGLGLACGRSSTGEPCDGVTRRIRIFANSNSDWLDEKWPIETLAEFLRLIHECQNLDWQLLTKRPELWRDRLELVENSTLIQHINPTWDFCHDWRKGGHPPDNIWLGVSVENQKYADERIPLLLQIPAVVRFLSCEPLLGPVDLSAIQIGHRHPGYGKPPEPYTFDARKYNWLCPSDGDLEFQKIDWVIAGGESGPKARPMHPNWARSLRDQCAAAGVPFYFKQWGEWAIDDGAVICDDEVCRFALKSGELFTSCSRRAEPVGSELLRRVGHKRAGRLLDGLEWSGFPKAKIDQEHDHEHEQEGATAQR
jgi:protein gp37